MKTTDEIIALSREQQFELYASMTDTERRKLWEQLDRDGHRFVYDRAARDYQILSTGSALGHPLHGEHEQLVEDYRKAREHAAEMQRRNLAAKGEA